MPLINNEIYQTTAVEVGSQKIRRTDTRIHRQHFDGLGAYPRNAEVLHFPYPFLDLGTNENE